MSTPSAKVSIPLHVWNQIKEMVEAPPDASDDDILYKIGKRITHAPRAMATAKRRGEERDNHQKDAATLAGMILGLVDTILHSGIPMSILKTLVKRMEDCEKKAKEVLGPQQKADMEDPYEGLLDDQKIDVEDPYETSARIVERHETAYVQTSAVAEELRDVAASIREKGRTGRRP